VKMTTDLHLVPRSRMLEAIPPLPNAFSWHGSLLSTGTTLPLLISPMRAMCPKCFIAKRKFMKLLPLCSLLKSSATSFL